MQRTCIKPVFFYILNSSSNLFDPRNTTQVDKQRPRNLGDNKLLTSVIVSPHWTSAFELRSHELIQCGETMTEVRLFL